MCLTDTSRCVCLSFREPCDLQPHSSRPQTVADVIVIFSNVHYKPHIVGVHIFRLIIVMGPNRRHAWRFSRLLLHNITDVCKLGNEQRAVWHKNAVAEKKRVQLQTLKLCQVQLLKQILINRIKIILERRYRQFVCFWQIQFRKSLFLFSECSVCLKFQSFLDFP